MELSSYSALNDALRGKRKKKDKRESLRRASVFFLVELQPLTALSWNGKPANTIYRWIW